MFVQFLQFLWFVRVLGLAESGFFRLRTGDRSGGHPADATRAEHSDR